MGFRLRAFLFLALALAVPACGPGTQTKVSTLASAPITLVATPVTTGRIDLTWTSTSDNEFEFRIERSDPPGNNFAQVGAAPKGSQAYSDLGLLPGSTYYYRISAWNSKGYSDYAGPASTSTLALSWAGPFTGGPVSGRGDHSAIYDSSSSGHRMIVFGGFDASSGGIFSTEVWSYDLTLPAPPSPWSLLTTTTQPPALTVPGLAAHSAVYDSLHNRMVVFGGQLIDAMSNIVYLNDVYVLDLNTLVWTKPTVTGPPPSVRAFHKAVYDSDHEEMIVLGGTDGSLELSDSYKLSLSTANPFAWNGPLTSGPVRREQHAAVVDPLRSRLVIFGGLDNEGADGSPLNQDSWTLTLNSPQSWSPLFFSGTPGFRFGHSGVYDAANQRMVIFGGNLDGTLNPTFSNEIWAMKLHSTPAWNILLPAGNLPLPRCSHTAIYDSVNNRMILYGGFDSFQTPFDDVWIIQL